MEDTEETLGVVHYWFPTNLVRSTPYEEHVGLRFEPRTQRPTPFPLRTTAVSDELLHDIMEFLGALVAEPVHIFGGSIKTLLRREDFRSDANYLDVRQQMIEVMDRMKRAGSLRPGTQPVLLRPMVERVCKDFAEMHSFFRVSAQEGDGNDSFAVQAQGEVLETVVRLLFSNAARQVVRRMDAEQANYAPTVRCALRADKHRVALSVIDNGGGMPNHVRDRLFEPFNKGPDGGSGLGLFYAAYVAQAFGGSLTLIRNGSRDGDTQFDLILHAFPEGAA